MDETTRVRCPLCDGNRFILLEPKGGIHRAIECWLCTFGSVDKDTFIKWTFAGKPIEKPLNW
jgi:hypothetical protein